jgi:large subunit ribosomal protein L24
MVSTQPRKQRKSRYQAPYHLRHKLMGAMLCPELREKHKIKSIPLRAGDIVKVMRGDNKGKEGKVSAVNLTSMTITVDGVSVAKSDGTEVPRPVQPSNVMIMKLETKDDMRLGD